MWDSKSSGLTASQPQSRKSELSSPQLHKNANIGLTLPWTNYSARENLMHRFARPRSHAHSGVITSMHMDSEWGWSRFPRKRVFYCQKEMNTGQTIDAYYCNEQSSLSGPRGGSEDQRPSGSRPHPRSNSPFSSLWLKLLC